MVWHGWFGVPIILWLGTAGLSAVLAKDSVLELAGPLMSAICVGGLVYITYSTQQANTEARKKREARNHFLLEEVRKNQTTASPAPEAGSRELDGNILRFFQWFLELGLTLKDHFSYHDVVDQFQTTAIRYQLYEAINCLGLYENVFCPNFHGKVNEADEHGMVRFEIKVDGRTAGKLERVK